MTYNSTLPKVFVYLLTTIETLYQTRVPLEVQNRKNVHLATSDCLVIACYLWGVLHFSETLKAKHQLAQSLFPNFLEYSRFVRRCNALLPSIQVIRQALVFKEVEGMSVSIIDSFPIPLCQPIRNFRSKVLGDYANVGYNATKGQYFYGCKCHALVSESGYVIDYTITPASMADSSMTEEVLSQFGTPTVLGDMGYLGQSLHDRLELKGIDPRSRYVLGYQGSPAQRISILYSYQSHRSSLCILLFSVRQAVHKICQARLLCAGRLG